MTVLTSEQVVDIFLSPEKYKILSHRFGITPSVISRIKKRHVHRAETAMFTAETLNALLVSVAFAVPRQ